MFGHLWVEEETYIYIFLPSSSLSGVCSLILFPLFATGVNATGVNDTGGKFAASVVDTGGIGVVDTGGKFAAGIVVSGGLFATGVNNTRGTGVVDTGGAP